MLSRIALGLLFATSISSYADCVSNSSSVLLRFSYGSEKEAFIKEVTERFNNENHTIANGKTVCVVPTAKGSGDMINEILNMKAGPDEVHIISPASDLYVELGNYKAKAQLGKEIFKKAELLVSSPVVIAMWEPVLAKFGGSPQGVSWKTLGDLAINDPSFRYGQTSPERSNSGFSALVAQFYAGAAQKGRVRTLGIEQVNDPDVRQFVKNIHSAVIHYGESTGFYVKNMVNGGPSYADAIVAYESDVIASNQALAKNESKFPKLIATYPTDGTFVANHPFVNIDAPWVDEDERQAAGVYKDYLLAPEQQLVAMKKGFRPSSSLELTDDTIKNVIWNEKYGVQAFDAQHRFLSSPPGEVLDAVLEAHLSTKKKVQLTLVVDTSGSMDTVDPSGAQVKSTGFWSTTSQATRIQGAISGASTIIDTLRDQDLFSVVRFSSDIQELVPINSPLFGTASGKSQGKRTLAGLNAGGGTRLYDSIENAWDANCKLMKQNPNDRTIRIILALTDGLDSQGRTGRELASRIGFGSEKQQGDAVCKIPVFGIIFGMNSKIASAMRESKDAAECHKQVRNMIDKGQVSNSDIQEDWCEMYQALKPLTDGTKGSIEAGNGDSVTAIFQKLSYFLQ